jgi:HlyD family secretion protein
VQAQTSLNNAQDELSVAKIELKKQELDLQNFLKSVKENSSEPQQKLREARSKVEQSQQDLDQAKLALNQIIRELAKVKIERQKAIEELRQKVITAPTNGVVLNLQVKIGDVIEPKSNILLIGDPAQQIVELKLSPLDATKVKLRQQAEVTIIGLESKKLTGKIQQISLLATEDQNNLQGADNIKVTAIVGLNKTNRNIVPGTPVTVTLILSQRNKVLVLPNEAVQQNDTETFVWIKDSQGKAIKRNIKIGLQGLDNTEIKSGLKLGDEVLIPPTENPLNVDSHVKIK